MSFYEGPSSNHELTTLAARRPTALLQSMLETLRAARWSGYLRSDVDLAVLAERIVQTMLQIGLDVIRGNAGPPDKSAILLCHILLEGLATGSPPSDEQLDGSAAFKAADAVVRSWTDDADAEPDDKPRTYGPSPERNSARRATRSRPSGTSRRPPAWAPAPCTG